MGRPKPPDPMAAAVKPVVTEILANEEPSHADGRIDLYREQMVPVGERGRRRSKAQGKERQHDVLAAESVGKRSEIRTPIVVAPHHKGENQALQSCDHNHDRQCKSENAGHVL